MTNKYKNLDLNFLSQIIILIFLSSFILKDIFVISLFKFKLDIQDFISLIIIPIFFIFYSNKSFLKNLNIRFGYLCLFFLFLILISIFYNSKINIGSAIFIFAGIITLLISYSLKIKDIYRLIKFFILYFAFVNFIFFFVQLLFSIINSSEVIQFGFFKERLFFISLLCLAYSIIIKDFKNFIFISILSVILLVIAIYTGSLTGTILITITIFVSNFKNHIRIISLLIIAALIITIVFPQHTINKVPKITKIISLISNKDERFQLQDHFWRFRSTENIINEFKKSPQILGHGYMSHAELLQNDFIEYRLLVGEPAKEKKLSTHTFPSIIYDQGILTFVLFVIILIVPIYRSSNYEEFFFKNDFLNILYILILLHSCLYYQGKPNMFFFMYFILFFNRDVLKKEIG